MLLEAVRGTAAERPAVRLLAHEGDRARSQLACQALEPLCTSREVALAQVRGAARRPIRSVRDADPVAEDVVLVCGAVPGLPLDEAREHIHDGIAALLPDCAAAGVKLAVEPLHPMYADSRSAINTLGQANDLCERLTSPAVGVAVDVYHLWWDPALEAEIARCGRLGKLFAYHVCDWRTPTIDLLNDRGLMGEGCIPLRQIRAWVEAAGWRGFNEVEVFSTRLWAGDQDAFLAGIVQSYRDHT